MKFRDGDVYRWKWKPKRDGRRRSYRGMSRIAIVHGALPRDTYSMQLRSDPVSGQLDTLAAGEVIDPMLAEFVFVAPLADLEEISHGEAVFYLSRDIVDFRTKENMMAPVYRLKGAQRDLDVMRSIVERTLFKALDSIETAQQMTDGFRRVEELSGSIARPQTLKH